VTATMAWNLKMTMISLLVPIKTLLRVGNIKILILHYKINL
jgi:hypothetical protein